MSYYKRTGKHVPQDQVIDRLQIYGNLWQRWLGKMKARKMIREFNKKNPSKQGFMVTRMDGPQYLHIKVYWEWRN